MKIKTLTTILAALALASSARAQREEQFSRTLDVGPDAALSIGNISGDILVEAAPGSSIVIEATKTVENGADPEMLQSVDIEVTQLGNRVRVSTAHTGRGRRHGRHGDNVSVSYRVKVPKGTDVEIQSVSGNVTLAGVEGTASAQSVSGEVRVSAVAELIQAKSVSGDVEVRRARSGRHASIESVSGSVFVEEIEAGELTVSSVSGDVWIDRASSRRASLKSVSGDLEYTGAIASGGRYEFQSHSGDVVLTLGDDVGFELEASTFSGDIESEFTLKTASRSQRARKGRLSAVVGDGSALIEASTFSGDVRIRRR